MSKRKVAVFVEGQTELVFVRDFLRNWYAYDERVLGFDCVTLFRDDMRSVPSFTKFAEVLLNSRFN